MIQITQEMDIREITSLICVTRKISLEEACIQIIETRKDYIELLEQLPIKTFTILNLTEDITVRILLKIAYMAIDRKDVRLMQFAFDKNAQAIQPNFYIVNIAQYALLNQSLVFLLEFFSSDTSPKLMFQDFFQFAKVTDLMGSIQANSVCRVVLNSNIANHKPGYFSPYIEVLHSFVQLQNWFPIYTDVEMNDLFHLDVNYILKTIHTMINSSISFQPITKIIPQVVATLDKLCLFHNNHRQATTKQAIILKNELLQEKIFAPNIIKRFMFRTMFEPSEASGMLSKLITYIDISWLRDYFKVFPPQQAVSPNAETLSRLPQEIWIYIFSYLTYIELLTVGRTCRDILVTVKDVQLLGGIFFEQTRQKEVAHYTNYTGNEL